jgi:translation initiation factor IF-2
MTQGKKSVRLSKVAKELNVGISTIVDFLNKKEVKIDANPNAKIGSDVYDMLLNEYSQDGKMKKDAEALDLGKHRSKPEVITIDKQDETEQADEDEGEEVIIKDLSSAKETSVKETPSKQEEKPEVKAEVKEVTKEDPKPAENKQDEKTEKQVSPIKVVGKINLDNVNKKRPVKRKEVPKVKEQPKTEAKRPQEKPKQEQPKGREKPQSQQSQQRPQKPKEEPKAELKKEAPQKEKVEAPQKDENFIESKIEKLSGPTVVGKIELPVDRPKSKDDPKKKKKRRKRIRKDKVDLNKEPSNNHSKPQPNKGGTKPQDRKEISKRNKKKRPVKPEVNEEDVQKQIKETLSRLTSKTKGKGAKHRRDKRDAVQKKQEEAAQQVAKEKNILKVTEFVSVSELANMMDVPANEVISTCMNLGLFVSINQRLDAETMALVADEFSYKVEFVSAEVLDAIEEVEADKPEDLSPRPPIVTVMGHVDHGKTSLLDHIRKANVIAGEAGGITQHIGAYNVILDDGRKITFLDTPGHEAFTAMRARGAQITDVAIIIIAADDSIMPQTKEAINHAQAAGVPIVFAINKIDKPGANPEKIKEELAQMNLMVEAWGGKYQSQDISAKNGLHIEELLEKVLLEAELLELKANPKKKAVGTVIESSLDKGRGYVATILVEGGTLKIGDIILAGSYFGHVKAMYNERGSRIEEAGPAVPVQILGLNGAPQAGDKFNIMDTDAEAKDIANKREQLQREQGLRAQKHITLDEIGRRIAIGNFQELNVIVKGDVDGSIEALSDSLIKLSTDEIQVNVIHKGVGQISESDILLAAASNAIIIGFQVRPSIAARKLAEKEEIDIRLYSVIYDAINELRDAMEGMLSPDIKEEIRGTAEVLEVFKITKVGKIAGCIVREGKINRKSKVRLIREGIVVYTGELGSLKRFKDDAKEVVSGYECGLNIENFNDIKVGDMVEAFEEVEVKKKL